MRVYNYIYVGLNHPMADSTGQVFARSIFVQTMARLSLN